MFFTKVILVGHGKIAKDILEHIVNIGLVKIDVIESEKSNFSTLNYFSKGKYKHHETPKNINKKINELISSQDGKVLIISANNNTIFPEKILKNTNLVIINFHNSFLPFHRGRNAPTWVIYDGDLFTGVSWHFIGDKLDSGKIFSQKKWFLNGDETALSLVMRSMKEGFFLFEKFYNKLIRFGPEKFSNKNYSESLKRKPHLSTDVPSCGVLNINKNNHSIYKLLRSVDYYPYQVFEPLRTVISEISYKIKEYSVNPPKYNNPPKRYEFISKRQILLYDNKFDINLTVKKINE